MHQVALYSQLVVSLEAAAAQAGALPLLTAGSMGPADPNAAMSAVDERVALSLGGLPAVTKTDKTRIGGTGSHPPVGIVEDRYEAPPLILEQAIILPGDGDDGRFPPSLPLEHQIGAMAWARRYLAQGARIPVEDLRFTGDLKRGMVVRSTVPEHELDLIYVPPRDWISRQREGQITFGHPAEDGDVQSLEVRPVGLAERELVRQLLTSWQTQESITEIPRTQAWSADVSGIEREYFVIDPATGELIQLDSRLFEDEAHLRCFLKGVGWGEELLKGMPEITEGEYVGAVSSALGSARRFSVARALLKQAFGDDVIIVALPTLPTGTPKGTKISDSPYVQVIQARLFGQLMKALDRRETTGEEPDLQFVLDQFATEHGYASARAMFEELGDMRTWAVAATHLSASAMIFPDDPSYFDDPTAYRGGWYALKDDVINLIQAIFSDLGSLLPRVMTMGGALYMGVPLVGRNGRLVLDAREATRNFLDTANEDTVFIDGAETLAGIIEQVTVARERPDGTLDFNGVVERIARAAGSTYRMDPHTGATRLHANHHSPKGRSRAERTGGDTHRVENTGPGATDIRTKARIVALQNVWQTLSKIALQEGLTFVELVQRETGLTVPEIWNNAGRILREVNYEQGITSPLFQEYLDRLVTVISILEKPAYQMKAKRETLAIAHAAVHSMRMASQTLEGYSRTGYGPIGIVVNNMIVEMRGQGLDDRAISLKIARLVADYQRQEEEAFLKASYQEALAYLTGEKGIPYKREAPRTSSALAGGAQVVSANVFANKTVLRRLHDLGIPIDLRWVVRIRAITRRLFEVGTSFREILSHVLSSLSSSGTHNTLDGASRLANVDPGIRTEVEAALHHLHIEHISRSVTSMGYAHFSRLNEDRVRRAVQQRAGFDLNEWELTGVMTALAEYKRFRDQQSRRLRLRRFTRNQRRGQRGL